jgi:hypothetical protein
MLKEISYNDIASHMRSPICTLINSIRDSKKGWIDFGAIVTGRKYIVTLCTTFDGFGSVLTSSKA